MLNNFITINFVPGGRGHQIGRLLSSCDNVSWYDYYRNGRHPWIPGDGTSMTEISKFHFDRRFMGASGVGVDRYTIPPVLDIASRNGYPEYPLDDMMEWNTKLDSKKAVYPLNCGLDVCKQFFSDSKHLVVINTDIDSLVDRFIKTTAKFIYHNPPLSSRDSNYERLTFKQYWERNNKDDSSYLEWVKNYATDLLENYRLNLSSDDVVIQDVDELFDQSRFKTICDKLGLHFNEKNHIRVVDIVNRDSFSPEVFTRSLTNKDVPLIEEFCTESDSRGFNNNSNLKTMKYHWCLEQGGKWFGTFKQEKIISLSGIHPFLDGWRAMFRGAQHEGRRIGLNRYQMTSYSLHSQLPQEIEYVENISGRGIPIYVTTNINHDASGNAGRVHKLFVELSKLGVFDHCGDHEIFNTLQSVWKLNREKYYDVRS